MYNRSPMGFAVVVMIAGLFAVDGFAQGQSAYAPDGAYLRARSAGSYEIEKEKAEFRQEVERREAAGLSGTLVAQFGDGEVLEMSYGTPPETEKPKRHEAAVIVVAVLILLGSAYFLFIK